MKTVSGRGRGGARRDAKGSAAAASKPKARRKPTSKAGSAPVPAARETVVDSAGLSEETELLIQLNDVELLMKEHQVGESVEAGLGFRLKEHRERLVILRQRLRDAISSEALGHFDRAWSRYGRALAPVSNGVCCGCFGRLPTSMSPGSLNLDRVICCPYCARLLYWPPQG